MAKKYWGCIVERLGSTGKFQILPLILRPYDTKSEVQFKECLVADSQEEVAVNVNHLLNEVTED